MKIKKTISILLALLAIVSCLSICASAANTGDSVYTYTWNSNSRYDYTNARKNLMLHIPMLKQYMILYRTTASMHPHITARAYTLQQKKLPHQSI